MSRQYIQNYELFIIWNFALDFGPIHFLENNLKNLTEEIEESFTSEGETFQNLEAGLQGVKDGRRRVPNVMAINWLTNRHYDFLIDRNTGTSNNREAMLVTFGVFVTKILTCRQHL